MTPPGAIVVGRMWALASVDGETFSIGAVSANPYIGGVAFSIRSVSDLIEVLLIISAKHS